MFSIARLIPLILFYYTVTRVDGNIKDSDNNSTDTVDSNDEDKFKIVGGRPVIPGNMRYPWFARAELMNTDGTNKWRGCGGSLVSREHVLTAAHCIDQTFRDTGGYMIGSLCTDKIDNCKQYEEWRTVKEVFIHPDYDGSTCFNDFAIVRLNEPTTINYVRMDDVKSTNYRRGTKLWAVGYGDTKTRSIKMGEGILHHVRMNYRDNEECEEVLNRELAYISKTVDITDDMMCVADNRKASCQGDSGGPLYNRKAGVLVGVVSWGLPSCLRGAPGVYARIATEYDWLATTICNSHDFPLPEFCEGYFDEMVDDEYFNPPTKPPVKPFNPYECNDIPCDHDHIKFKIILCTDDKFKATHYNLKKRYTRNFEKILEEVGLAASAEQCSQLCIPEGSYKFTIKVHADGLCCEHGNGQFKYFIDGVLKGSYRMKNRDSKKIAFAIKKG